MIQMDMKKHEQHIMLKVQRIKLEGWWKTKKQTNQEGNENEMQKYKKDLKKRGVQEQFSDWREEFLWEVDKKYPEKVKEIKPMTGKNTITVNPEDKCAKYKRGY